MMLADLDDIVKMGMVKKEEVEKEEVREMVVTKTTMVAQTMGAPGQKQKVGMSVVKTITMQWLTVEKPLKGVITLRMPAL